MKILLTALIVVAIFLILVLGLLTWTVFRNINTPQTNHYHTSDHHKLDEDPIIQSDGAVLLPPMDLKDPHLSNYGIDYVLTGTIREVRTTPEGTEIVTNDDIRIPRLLVTSETAISFGKNNNQITKKGSVQDLKPGMNINYISMYLFKTKQWKLMNIFIQPN